MPTISRSADLRPSSPWTWPWVRPATAMRSGRGDACAGAGGAAAITVQKASRVSMRAPSAGPLREEAAVARPIGEVAMQVVGLLDGRAGLRADRQLQRALHPALDALADDRARRRAPLDAKGAARLAHALDP